MDFEHDACTMCGYVPCRCKWAESLLIKAVKKIKTAKTRTLSFSTCPICKNPTHTKGKHTKGNKIQRKDLILKKLGCFSESDLPCGLYMHDLESFCDDHKEVFIGNFPIARIFKAKNNRYYVGAIYNNDGFVSLEGAIKGILERMRS